MGINQDFHPFPPSISEPKKHPAFLEANLFRSDVQQVIGASVTVQVGEVVGTGVELATLHKGPWSKSVKFFSLRKNLKLERFGETIAR